MVKKSFHLFDLAFDKEEKEEDKTVMKKKTDKDKKEIKNKGDTSSNDKKKGSGKNKNRNNAFDMVEVDIGGERRKDISYVIKAQHRNATKNKKGPEIVYKEGDQGGGKKELKRKQPEPEDPPPPSPVSDKKEKRKKRRNKGGEEDDTLFAEAFRSGNDDKTNNGTKVNGVKGKEKVPALTTPREKEKDGKNKKQKKECPSTSPPPPVVNVEKKKNDEDDDDLFIAHFRRPVKKKKSSKEKKDDVDMEEYIDVEGIEEEGVAEADPKRKKKKKEGNETDCPEQQRKEVLPLDDSSRRELPSTPSKQGKELKIRILRVEDEERLRKLTPEKTKSTLSPFKTPTPLLSPKPKSPLLSPKPKAPLSLKPKSQQGPGDLLLDGTRSQSTIAAGPSKPSLSLPSESAKPSSSSKPSLQSESAKPTSPTKPSLQSESESAKPSSSSPTKSGSRTVGCAKICTLPPPPEKSETLCPPPPPPASTPIGNNSLVFAKKSRPVLSSPPQLPAGDGDMWVDTMIPFSSSSASELSECSEAELGSPSSSQSSRPYYSVQRETANCVNCGKEFRCKGCHYSKIGLSIAGLKRRYCAYFGINTAQPTKTVDDFLRKEKYPFCPDCFIHIHDLYRRAEQLELSQAGYDKAKELVKKEAVRQMTPYSPYAEIRRMLQ